MASKFDIMQHAMDRTNAAFDDLNRDYSELIAALRDRDWIRADRLQKQVRATTDIVLGAMLSSFVLINTIDGEPTINLQMFKKP